MLNKIFALGFSHVPSVFVLLFLLSLLSVTSVFAQDAQTCEAGFRLFDHENLATDPVCIPENPQRIVAFDMSAIELGLLTGKDIVGAYDSFKDEMQVITPGLTDQLADIPNTGLPPNLELITQSAPDLIVTIGGDENYQVLSSIAPTVVLSGDTFTNDWKRSTEFWSKVFNVEDAYQEMLDTYNARVEELQQALGEDRGDIQVSLFTANPGWLSIWMRNSAQGKILQDVGLGRPEAQDYSAEEAQTLFDSPGYESISEETLDLADGDVVFVFAYASTDAEIASDIDVTLGELQENVLWQTLNAVRNEHVYAVGPYWYREFTYLQANLILNDLFRYVAHTEPSIPDPAAAFITAEATATP